MSIHFAAFHSSAVENYNKITKTFIFGDHLTQWHEILSQNTRDSRLLYGENPKSLSHLVLKQYPDVTPRQTKLL